MFSKELFQAAMLTLALGVESASAYEWEYNLTDFMPHMRRMIEGELRLAQRGLIPPFGQSYKEEKIHGNPIECDPTTGLAGKFPCKNVDFISFTPDADLVSDPKYESKASDIWGWTNPDDGKEWAIHTTRTGFSFVDISDAFNPVPVAFLPRAGSMGSVWSDVKVYKDHAYCVADSSSGQFMQVVDLKRVAGLQPQASGKPVEIKEDVHFKDWSHGGSGAGSAHNIVINEDTGFAYIVGQDACDGKKGGLLVVNIKEPKNPKFVTCFADKFSRRGYVHDAQCLIYRGPDVRYSGRELCFAYNEDKLVIFDVEDKKDIQVISAVGYNLVEYTHQGWLNDAQSHLLMNDELDEKRHEAELGGGRTRTLVWDVTDLKDPKNTYDFLHPEIAIDHNNYILNDVAYQSNYAAGLKVLDVRNVQKQDGVTEIGKFDFNPKLDTTPGDEGVEPELYASSWSNYPYFKSKVIIASDIENGLFLVKLNEAAQKLVE